MGMFGDSLRKNNKKILEDINTGINKVIVDGFNQAVVFSPAKPEAPYAQGHFINNWYLGINTTDNSTSSSTNMQGSDSYSRIAQLLVAKAFVGKDGFVTLTNSVDYGDKIEMSGWPSGKPPYRPLGNMVTYFISKNK